MTAIRIIVSALLALPAGWFTGLLVDRVPAMGRDADNNLRDPHAVKLLAKPRSVQLHGKYLWIDAILVGAFAATAYRFVDEPPLVTLPYLVWWMALLTLATTDITHRRLPDRIVLPTFVFGLALIVVVSVLTQRAVTVRYALITAGVYFGLFFVLNLIHPALAGFGDVKAAGPAGLIVGWSASSAGEALQFAAWGIFLLFVLAAVVGFASIVRGGLRSARRQQVGLGTYFGVSCFIMVMVSPVLVGG
ncbi:MAG: prepilin peptidase [Actinobacteria bacterium]|nr:prepilin peptidase [Actinomycetota bacterium]